MRDIDYQLPSPSVSSVSNFKDYNDSFLCRLNSIKKDRHELNYIISCHYEDPTSRPPSLSSKPPNSPKDAPADSSNQCPVSRSPSLSFKHTPVNLSNQCPVSRSPSLSFKQTPVSLSRQCPASRSPSLSSKPSNTPVHSSVDLSSQCPLSRYPSFSLFSSPKKSDQSLINLSRKASVLSSSSDSTLLASSSLQAGPGPKVDFIEVLPEECFKGYSHATWYVLNAKQTAAYFVTCFGFEHVAYRGLETGSKLIASHVVKNGNIFFEFVSPISYKSNIQKEANYLNSIFDFIKKHGDGVKDIAFRVDNVDTVYEHAIRAGAKSVSKPEVFKDSNGSAKIATIEVFDDIYHTLIENVDYSGVFLPGYHAVQGSDLFNSAYAISIKSLPKVNLNKIDHCVQNEDWNSLESACDVYTKIFSFHKFWSVDEKDISTEYSALRSIVMASDNNEIKMPMNEPAKGLCKSQIEEFLDFYGGPGVQHIALLTDDIVETVRNMRSRGAEFIKVPKLYYEHLLPKLLKTGVYIEEDLEELKKQDILIDFDENGYLLQIFTKPLTDRPTFFLEIIQRHNHNGFGKGNFKSLFETIEAEQRLRGTLESK